MSNFEFCRHLRRVCNKQQESRILTVTNRQTTLTNLCNQLRRYVVQKQ